MPLCAGGTKIGMLECAIPSDPFVYILMKNPKLSSKQCKCITLEPDSLGFIYT